MGRLIYSMQTSLVGYIEGPDGDFSWATPDDEVHWVHNEQTRELGAHLIGRRLYEVMTYWDTAEEDTPDLPAPQLEFARLWVELPKIVFSRTLSSVGRNARLADGELAEEVARVKEETDGDIAIGGPGLAAGAVEQGLVDEYRLFVYPVIVGGGKPFLPAAQKRIDLELIETRTFGSKVTYVRYAAR
jgi:dihydrofolate reductase